MPTWNDELNFIGKYMSIPMIEEFFDEIPKKLPILSDILDKRKLPKTLYEKILYNHRLPRSLTIKIPYRYYRGYIRLTDDFRYYTRHSPHMKNYKAFKLIYQFLKESTSLSFEFMDFFNNRKACKLFANGKINTLIKATFEDLNNYTPNGRITKNFYHRLIGNALKHDNTIDEKSRTILGVLSKELKNKRILTIENSIKYSYLNWRFMCFVSTHASHYIRNKSMVVSMKNHCYKYSSIYFPEYEQLFFYYLKTPLFYSNYVNYINDKVQNDLPYIKHYKTVASKMGCNVFTSYTYRRINGLHFIVEDSLIRTGFTTLTITKLHRELQSSTLFRYMATVKNSRFDGDYWIDEEHWFDEEQRPAFYNCINFNDLDIDMMKRLHIIKYNEEEKKYDLDSRYVTCLAHTSFLPQSISLIPFTSNTLKLFLNDASLIDQQRGYTYHFYKSGYLNPFDVANLTMYGYYDDKDVTDFIENIKLKN